MNRIVLMVLNNLAAAPGAWIKLCRYAKNPEKYTEKEMYGHIQYILQEAIKGGNVSVEVHGQENIPEENGFLLTSNHQGMFDILAIVANCDNPMGGVYKIELDNKGKGIPLIKEIIRCTKSFAMDRSDVRQSLTVIQNVTEELKKGRNYLIFPEGTRSRNGNVMGEFHGGSFRCAVKAKAPILPIAVIDCHRILDEKGSKPLTAQVHFLKPIPYEEYQDMKPAELAALVKSRIAEKIQECTQGG